MIFLKSSVIVIFINRGWLKILLFFLNFILVLVSVKSGIIKNVIKLLSWYFSCCSGGSIEWAWFFKFCNWCSLGLGIKGLFLLVFFILNLFRKFLIWFVNWWACSLLVVGIVIVINILVMVGWIFDLNI